MASTGFDAEAVLVLSKLPLKVTEYVIPGLGSASENPPACLLRPAEELC